MSDQATSGMISAGYMLAKRTLRPDYICSQLMPERILSASECLVDFVPDLWTIDWTRLPDEERAKKARVFGMDAAARRQVSLWVEEGVDKGAFGWPNVFFSTDDAREFVRRFVPGQEDLVLFGLGLPERLSELFIESETPSDETGASGVFEAISRLQPLEDGGRVLGFEILGYDTSGYHSWLCNGLEQDVADELSVRPNADGFVDTYHDAMKAAEFCGRDEVGAEPGFWAPWLVVEYDL